MSRVLVISPHCDDETYGMGGTILKRIQQGDEIYIITVCAGEVFFEHNDKLIGRDVRLDEFSKVLSAYNCGGTNLGFTQESALDTVPLNHIINAIERVQDDFKASVFYVAGNSYHQDHRRVFEATAAVARPSRRYFPKEIYTYEHPLYSWNPPEWKFNPQIYEDISEFLDKKMDICNIYESQIRNGFLSPDHIRNYSIACGSGAGVYAAERFEAIRIIR